MTTRATGYRARFSVGKPGGSGPNGRRSQRFAGALACAGMALALTVAMGPAIASPATAVGSGSSNRVVNGDMLILHVGRLALVAPDGTNRRQLTSIRDYDIRARFSPDGSRIVFSDTDGDLLLMNADGTNRRTLKSGGAITYNSPAFSRDGTKIVFKWYGWTGNHGVGYMAARPGAPMTTIIKDGPDSPRCTGGSAWPDGQYLDPVWSPVADQLAVFQNCWATWQDHHSVHIVSLQGERIGEFERGLMMQRPDFSPDGRRIVYSEGEDRYHDSAINVLDRRTGSVVRLTDEDGQAITPAWSPDGTRIAYVAGTQDGYREAIYTVRAPGGGGVRQGFVADYGLTLMDWRAAR